MPKLTKRVVDALAPDPDGGDVFSWDSELRGLGIRIKPSGAASWIIQYRNAEGRTRRKVIGKVGTLTPDEARKLARDDLVAVAGGADPSAARREARKAITVGELCDLYMEAADAGLVTSRFKRPKRESTVAFDKGRIERHIRPLLGNEPIRKLTPALVQRMADDIAIGKTAGRFKTKARGLARVGGGTGTARRVVEFLGGMWTWAEKRGHVAGPNPAHGVETARGAPKDRTLSAVELTALGKTLNGVKPEEAAAAAAAAIRLIALTALRRAEAVALRCREVDLAGSCIRLEDSKTGRSIRPIRAAAVDHLRALLPAEDEAPREFLFPASRGTRAADLAKTIASLFDAAGLSDARCHDLRRTFASIAADEGYSDATIGELLGHARRGVTAVHYIRRPDAALVAAADKVSARIAAGLNRKGPASVAEMASAQPSA